MVEKTKTLKQDLATANGYRVIDSSLAIIVAYLITRYDPEIPVEVVGAVAVLISLAINNLHVIIKKKFL